MILKKEEQEDKRPVIDLTGPDGNAFALMGNVKRWCRDLSFTEENTSLILADMQSGDYDHLLEVVEENFGQYVIMLK
jgi:hypothetical protein